MIDRLKRLCIVTTGLGIGGAETQIVALATELRLRGWIVELVSLLPPHAFIKELEMAGIQTHSLNMRRGIADPRALFRLIMILRRFRPTVVHGHMIHANLLARIARFFSDVPVLVCTAHSVNERGRQGGRTRDMAYRLTDPMCDLTTQICQAGMDRYVKIGATPKDKIRFVPNGINVDRFYPDMNARVRVRGELRIDEHFVWLAVGSFQDVKDHTNLIRAFGQARAVQANALLLLVGDGPLRPDIEKLVESLGLAECVRFLGNRMDIPEIMNAADAYVMSSKWEGMPIVLLEASATGLPILATWVGGIPEVVQDGISGMLVPAQDSDALASGMMFMMGLQTHDLKRMGQSGRDFMKSCYSLSAVVDQWEMLYDELLAHKVGA